MREHLLVPEEARPSVARRFRRLRGGQGEEVCIGVVAAFFAFALGTFFFCYATVGPNQIALTQNYLSGAISHDVTRGGLHFIGPMSRFIPFPATQIILEFSSHGAADRPKVLARTGADPNDPESGGQQIWIGCAVQILFDASRLRDVFLDFGSYDGARERYTLLAGNMVSNTAQEFTPQDFWLNREKISDRMLVQINHTIWEHGYGIAVNFEIMRVDFAKQFEDAITGVQVAEQQKQVNTYKKAVEKVVQEIAVLTADNDASIANINAEAQANAKEVCALARRNVFNRKQKMKTDKYAELQTRLGFNEKNMAEYFKIKALQTQPKIVVGIPPIGGRSSASLPSATSTGPT